MGPTSKGRGRGRKGGREGRGTGGDIDRTP